MTPVPARESLRVLLVSDSYPPLIGGATRAAQLLAHELTARGHTVSVATAWQPGSPAFELDEGVPVHRVRSLATRVPGVSADPFRSTPPPFPDPEAAVRLRRVLARERPDIVHAYGWLTYPLWAALRGLGDVPLLLSARDYGHVCPVRTLVRQGRDAGAICTGPEVRKCMECAGAYYGTAKAAAAVAGVLGERGGLARRADGLHSPSAYVRDVMERLMPEASGAPSEVVPDFRTDAPAGPPDPELLAQLPDEPFILFVGALRRIKGIHVLLDAYGQMDEPRPPLVLIGSRAPDAPPVPPEVITLNDVPHATVMAAWDRALFGVSPSVVPETFGNVVHEAMSRGRVMIGTTPGGHPDMIDDGVNGILVPSGQVAPLVSALNLLAHDADARGRMAGAAGASAAAFTAANVVPRFEALYRQTIAYAKGADRGRPRSVQKMSSS